MATHYFKRNLLLNLYREGKISLVCSLLPLKRDKNVWHLQAISSIWRPLAFLPVTLSLLCKSFPLSWLTPQGRGPCPQILCILFCLYHSPYLIPRRLICLSEVWDHLLVFWRCSVGTECGLPVLFLCHLPRSSLIFFMTNLILYSRLWVHPPKFNWFTFVPFYG